MAREARQSARSVTKRRYREARQMQAFDLKPSPVSAYPDGETTQSVEAVLADAASTGRTIEPSTVGKGCGTTIGISFLLPNEAKRFRI